MVGLRVSSAASERSGETPCKAALRATYFSSTTAERAFISSVATKPDMSTSGSSSSSIISSSDISMSMAASASAGAASRISSSAVSSTGACASIFSA